MDAHGFDKEGTFAKVHIVSIIPPELRDRDGFELAQDREIINIITNCFLSFDQEVGDLIVEPTLAGYRTDGVFIVGHNKKIMELSDKPDDYGTLPREFRIWQFTNPRTGKMVNHDYWHGALDNYWRVHEHAIGPLAPSPDYKAYWHNNMVFFDPSDFGLYSQQEDIVRRRIFSSNGNYAVSRNIAGKKCYFCTEDDLTKKDFLNRVNYPSYIEMANDDAKKKYRTGCVVFRV